MWVSLISISKNIIKMKNGNLSFLLLDKKASNLLKAKQNSPILRPLDGLLENYTVNQMDFGHLNIIKSAYMNYRD